MDSKERFSSRVENYVKYRPHYPGEILPFLEKEIGFGKNRVVADIGSGTGISAEIFLANGNRVYGVEPNREMRLAAEAVFAGNKDFISTVGTAEATTLEDASIDLIVAGQAFHWFDRTKAKQEFHRIVKPGGYLLLMWNHRKLESDFQKAYEAMLLKYALNYKEVTLINVDAAAIKEFFAPAEFHGKTFDNIQELDFESLKGRVLSSSYAPLEGHPNYRPMLDHLKEIFDAYSVDSKVRFEYTCDLYFGSILRLR